MRGIACSFQQGVLSGYCLSSIYLILCSNACDYLALHLKEQHIKREKKNYIKGSLKFSGKWQQLKIKPKNYTNNF